MEQLYTFRAGREHWQQEGRSKTGGVSWVPFELLFSSSDQVRSPNLPGSVQREPDGRSLRHGMVILSGLSPSSLAGTRV
jgi:hypothetical protein